LLYCGGIMSVILNPIIMLMKLPRIPQILGFIFRGNRGGTLQFKKGKK